MYWTINKPEISSAQYSEYSQQYCIISIQHAKRLGLNYSTTTNKDNYFDMIEVLIFTIMAVILQYINGCYTPSIYTMLYVK